MGKGVALILAVTTLFNTKGNFKKVAYIPEPIKTAYEINLTDNVEVLEVVDTNLLKVDIKGKERYITMSGIETYKKDTKLGGYIHNYLKTKLEGKQVVFEKDPKSRLNMYHGYVWLDGELVNLELIKKGYAEVRKEEANYEFIEEEIVAKSNLKGIWGNTFKGELDHGNVVNPYVMYTYDQMVEDLRVLKEMYPDLVEIEVLGQSVEGRDIILVKLGKGDIKIHLNGSMHAREYFTTNVLMKMVDEYAYRYSLGENYGEYDVKSILDKVTMYIVPMVNPDGVNIAQKGLEGVKNPDKLKSMVMVPSIDGKVGYKYWKANANGVDLNNQFENRWENKVTGVYKPSSERFKGYYPLSEPEAKILKELSDEYDFEIYASFHTKGRIIYWADFTVKDWDTLKPIAKGLSELTGYDLVEPLGPSNYGACYADWVRETKQKPSFTIELCLPGLYASFPDKDFDIEWERVKYVGLYLANEAIKLRGE